jgi:orotidine-5'-phosphate decarboxylase
LGAGEIQDLVVTPDNGEEARPLYQWIAKTASGWNDAGNVGLVVGATYPDELRQVRDLCPEMPILIPGVGAQLGALEKSVEYGTDSAGRNAIFNVSRSVIYASRDSKDFAQAARRVAESLRKRINWGLELQGTPLKQLATSTA